MIDIHSVTTSPHVKHRLFHFVDEGIFASGPIFGDTIIGTFDK